MNGSGTCGCCEPVEIGLDPHVNAAGLPAIAYRIGDWATFRARLLQNLSRTKLDDGRRPLAALTSRSVEDPTIALLDAVAVLGDVLTFYQERIAGEHYLRTATERRSVLELARSIGYELRPGVSATVDLAVVVEDAPGAPLQADVPAGTRVTSIPAPGQLPQTFETSASLHATAAFNALRPRRQRPQRLALYNETLVRLVDDVGGDPAAAPIQIPAADLVEIAPVPGTAPAAGTTVGAEECDRIDLTGTATRLVPGDRILAVGRTAASPPEVETLVLLVTAVLPDPALGRTTVVVKVPPADTEPELRPRRAKDGLPPLDKIITEVAEPFTAKAVETQVIWAALDASALEVILQINSWTITELTAYVTARARALSEPGEPGLFAFRERVGFFGATAPPFAFLPEGSTGPDWDKEGWPIWKSHPGNGAHPDGDAVLERSVRGVGPDSWAVFEQGDRRVVFQITAATEVASTGFSLAARGTALTLAPPGGGTQLPKDATLLVRTTTALVASEPLVLTELPVSDPLDDAGIGVTVLALDGFYPGLAPGLRLAVQGEQLDAAGVVRHEIAEIEQVVHLGGVTRVSFVTPLAHRYRRDSVTINANVARATHGRTVVEVLGGGDATVGNQRFALAKPPLTHLPAAPSGAAPALEVRVDGIAWTLAETLHDAGPDDQRYLVRREDDGRTSIVFGDGRHGARLPSGTENVTAVYRSGTGTVGEVAASSITQLETKPGGVRGVTNPTAAGGSEDPEERDSARVNAPRQVLTFGRVVSRDDAEQFVRGYPGIGKAQATVVRIGPASRVVVAAATTGGLPVDEAAMLPVLTESLAGAADPSVGVLLIGYRQRSFDVQASLAVDPRHRFDDVEAAGRGALLAAFGFAPRQFGQFVTAAEVVATLAAVSGVLGVDLNVLAPSPAPEGITGPPPTFLTADRTRWNGVKLVAPVLLTVNPLGIILVPMPTGATP